MLPALAVLTVVGTAAFVACNPSTTEDPVLPRLLDSDGAAESGPVVSDAAMCGLACGEGGACCGQSCTSSAWDPDNCGGCGISCNAASATGVGACVQGACSGLDTIGGPAAFPGRPAEVVLSGSVLYADLPTAGPMPIGAIDLGAQVPTARAVPLTPTLLPIADGRGGVYDFETPASGHLLVKHYDYSTNVATTLDDLGAGALPHVLIRQGASVARVFSPTVGVLRTVCANGTVHDLAQSSGVAFGAADDTAVYFGFGSPVTPAVRVACEEGGAVTNLPTTFGHVFAVDAKNTYWFGVDLTMDASPVAGIFASVLDGSTRARLVVHPPVTSSLVTFPLLTGSTLYFLYSEHLPSGTPITVLASVDVAAVTTGAGLATVHTHLSSASPIALDPAFAYTTAAQGSGEVVVRLPLSP